MKKLIFLGTNSVLERHIDACVRQGQPIEGIIDSDWFGNRKEFAGLPILDSQEIFTKTPNKYNNYVFFIGVNWNPLYQRDFDKRLMMIDIVNRYNLECINLIDPSSYVSSYAKLGKGIFIGANVSIEPNVILNDFVTVWNNSVILHDVNVGENTVIQRQAFVHAKTVGKNTYIGMSAVVTKNFDINIGDNVVITPCVHVARSVDNNEKITHSVNSDKIYKKGRGSS
jgi:acetyltransferase-like isoleucine patch superfamily enzyme